MDYRNCQTCRSRLGLTEDCFLLTGPGRARIDLDHFGDPPLSAIILCPDPQGRSTRDPHIASRLSAPTCVETRLATVAQRHKAKLLVQVEPSNRRGLIIRHWLLS